MSRRIASTGAMRTLRKSGSGATSVDGDPLDWMALAECQFTDPELFFPEKGAARWSNPYAKKICGNCPVQAECLELWKAGVTDDRDHGVWFGTVPQERGILRQKILAGVL